ncbi:MAG: DUF4080 domain-containing protein [Burkholderiaceae bacterium]
MTAVVLATINARHAHSSLALRCLFANLGRWQSQARLIEFVTGARIESMAEALLAESPRIIGLSVYIWNVDETTRLIGVLKALAPDVRIVIGGPEVSHEPERQPIVALADFLITGPGEISLRKLCDQLLDGPPPLMKRIAGETGDPDTLCPPYPWYTAHDIAHRHLYVEASRGCPFKCEFCLSSLDRTAVPFDTGRFLGELDALYRRGARRFKFIDRTFNLKVATSVAILDFFLARIADAPDDPVFAHFELVPDHLPAALRDRLAAFPPSCLQLEIGIQTWDPQVQRLISRRQDNDEAQSNLRWLRESTHAHLHVDLIAGLPGEDLPGFAAGFDRLWALRPHEIQVGVLKRLRGTPIIRHTEAYGLRFNPNPPYNVLATDRIAFTDMQRLNRFARYWDLVANAGRFAQTLPWLLGDAPFARFMAFSDWLYARTDSTYRFAAPRLHRLLADWLRAQPLPPGTTTARIDRALADDGRALGTHRQRETAAPPRQQRFAHAETPGVAR